MSAQQPVSARDVLHELTYFLRRHTAYPCFVMMAIMPMVHADLLSLAFPCFTFLWGLADYPNPSKLFWMTVLVYTIAQLMLRYAFHFDFWGDVSRAPDGCDGDSFRTDCASAVVLFGLDRDSTSTRPSATRLIPDLILLFFLGMHKLALQSLGLWRCVTCACASACASEWVGEEAKN